MSPPQQEQHGTTSSPNATAISKKPLTKRPRSRLSRLSKTKSASTESKPHLHSESSLPLAPPGAVTDSPAPTKPFHTDNIGDAQPASPPRRYKTRSVMKAERRSRREDRNFQKALEGLGALSVSREKALVTSGDGVAVAAAAAPAEAEAKDEAEAAEAISHEHPLGNHHDHGQQQQPLESCSTCELKPERGLRGSQDPLESEKREEQQQLKKKKEQKQKEEKEQKKEARKEQLRQQKIEKKKRERKARKKEARRRKKEEELPGLESSMETMTIDEADMG